MTGAPPDTHPFVDHDRFFKELLSTFFYEFLDLFFPKFAESLERSAPEFLNQEIFVNQLDGDQYCADLLVRARAKPGRNEACFLIHIEHQSTAPTNFPVASSGTTPSFWRNTASPFTRL